MINGGWPVSPCTSLTAAAIVGMSVAVVVERCTTSRSAYPWMRMIASMPAVPARRSGSPPALSSLPSNAARTFVRPGAWMPPMSPASSAIRRCRSASASSSNEKKMADLPAATALRAIWRAIVVLP